MRVRLGLTAFAVALAAPLAACGDGGSATLPQPAADAPLLRAAHGGIDGEYIVVLEDGADPTAVAAVAGVAPQHVYRTALTGFAARLNGGQLAALRHHPAVAFVEQNRVFEAQWVQSPAPWGLDRIDQPNLPLNNAYVFNTTAPRVNAYVIDTGIRTALGEFGGRANPAFDAFGGTAQDCHGHGTGVAAVIGAKTYGVAKEVKLWSVRVLDCTGAGTTAGIIAGVNWVAANHVWPAVANLSLGGGFSGALNAAVDNLYTSGVFVAVAAGNGNVNACGVSPASAANAVTVTASDAADNHVFGSNFGGCVNLYAPGRNVPTITLSGAPTLAHGTSIATPHVTGTAALAFMTFGGTAAGVRAWILANATPGVIIGVPPGTPNRLLFKAAL